MTNILRREAIFFWFYSSIIFEQIFVFWALGLVAGSAISIFGKQQIHKLFAALQHKRLGVPGIIAAGVLGAASPLCMYGTIPIVAMFSLRGMKDDLLASFMVSSILLNPQLIIYSAALGTTALVIRIATCLLCGIIAGFCLRVFYVNKGKRFFRFMKFEEPPNRDTDPHIIVRFLKNLWRNIKITTPYFLLGIAITVAFQRYVPDDIIVQIFGNNTALGVLMAASLGVPLYACGGGTIPLIQQWLATGMSMGSAAAFMIAGPATKITNLGALKIVLGAKCFGMYILFCLFYAFISGMLIDFII
jgi:uncharacterized membrane protein YraQ (UPF0718 family)